MSTIRKTFRQWCLVTVLGGLGLQAGGCMALPFLGMAASAIPSMGLGGGGDKPDMDRLQKKQELMQKLMGDPQLPAWHAGREKITQASGEKAFDKSFDQVFDAVLAALPTLEVTVNTNERQSGYLTCGVPRLEPVRAKKLQREALEDYCQQTGYDKSLLDKKGEYEMDLDSMAGMSRMGQQMTITLARQSPTRTTVKIRFSQVNYPGELAEYYKVVWPAIEKQMGTTKATD